MLGFQKPGHRSQHKRVLGAARRTKPPLKSRIGGRAKGRSVRVPGTFSRRALQHLGSAYRSSRKISQALFQRTFR
jgi:hypothetical protein